MKLNKKAFTLVEMLIVVVIIGILAAALLPKLMQAQAKARDTAREAHLNQILAGLKSYFDDEGAFPTYANTQGCVGTGNNSGFFQDMDNYLSEVPIDKQKNREIQLDGTNMCVGGYGYLPLEYAGTKEGAGVLAANMEVFGSKMNWVMQGATDSSDSILATSETESTLTDDYDATAAWDMKTLIDLKCKQGVFQDVDAIADKVTCTESVTRGSAAEDWQGVYVLYVN